MTNDTVDDLHAAEDHIGCLEVWMTDAVDLLRALQPLEAVDVQRVIDKLTFEPYCRASCSAGECEDGCGCQAHGDDPHPGWLRRRNFEQLIAEIGQSRDLYSPLDEDTQYALVEYNTATTEQLITEHVGREEALKYAADQEDAWQPQLLMHLESGSRWKLSYERRVFCTAIDASEAVTSDAV